MPMHNVEIAAALNKLADLLEIEGANPYRVRAYRNAAQTVAGLSRSVADMVAAGEDLSELPCIGEALCNKLVEIVQTGHLSALEKEERKLAPTLTELLKVPGLGPRRVRALYERLKIADLEQLKRAARAGRLRELPGFGALTERKILDFLRQTQEGAARCLRAAAAELLESLVGRLAATPGVARVEPAGSFRRCCETVGDLDVLAAAEDAAAAIAAFTGHEDVLKVLAQGDTRASVVLRSGLQADLRVVPAASFGAALHYFTGSKSHNIAIRTRGVERGLKINEYGVFRGEERIGGAREEDVFAAVGLPLIAPELRENRGEIEAAEQGRLPALVRLEDIRGDLQSHTDATDGRDSLERMAEAAQGRGYAYLAVTDHSKHLAMARGLNATRLARQLRAIDKLNSRFQGFRLLKSCEVDILEDGSLDLSDDVLRELDLVVAAVHYRFALSRDRQTERIIRALDNPCVHVLAHPTGRLINERPPLDLDLERLLLAARDRGCFLELNAQPSRLDLADLHCRQARELGVKIVISTDAHAAAELAFMRYGVDQARRGWLTAADVPNTRDWAGLQKLLRPRS